ncbi:Uncharacterised protein [Klebsiella variicola]|nr:Uncharacterised protein [Klebsiella variicola]SLX07205.1 Uncharacterised protein [Klebsiella variicola]
MSKNIMYIYVIVLNVMSYMFPTQIGLVIVIDVFVILSYITSFIMDKWYFNDR